MQFKVMCTWLMIVVALVFVCPQVFAAEKQPSVLFVTTTVGGYLKPFVFDDVFKAKLHERGFDYQFDSIGYEDVTPEKLSQYNVVLMIYPEVTGELEKSPYGKAFPTLLDYAKKGGGLFIFGDEHYSVHKNLNKFLTQICAEVIPEAVIDDSALFQQPLYLREWFCSTNNITPHPITEGVKELWYPLGKDIRSLSPGTMTMKVDDNWQVVIRGNKNAYSYNSNPDAQDKETYPNEPPIVAVRKLGDGRVVLFPTLNVAYVHQPYHQFYKGIALERGNGFRFITNVIDWLTEPSLESGTLGGYVEPEKEIKTLPEIDYSKIEVEDYYNTIIKYGARPFKTEIEHKQPERKDYVGLVGLHSSYSAYPPDLTLNSVDELSAKARQLGYDFVVFTELYERLDKEKWEQFVADCKRNTDENFVALPGIEIMDMNGDTYITFGIERFPTSEKLAKEKRIMGYGEYLGYYGQFRDWAPQYMLNPSEATSPYHAFQSGIEVYSYLHGNNLIGSALQKYLWYQSNGGNIAPIVSHRLYYINELSQVEGPRVHVLAKDISSIRDEFKYPGYGQSWVYVSSGPKIRDFSIENGRAGYREEPWKIYIDLVSETPIKEVIIYDREKDFMRFEPDSTMFSKVITGYHDKQRHFTMVAKDANGGEVVSWPLYTTDFKFSTYSCTDLQNTLNVMYHVTRKAVVTFFPVQGHYSQSWDALSPMFLAAHEDWSFTALGAYIEYSGVGGWSGNAGHRTFAKDKTEYSVGFNDMYFDSGDCNILDRHYTNTFGGPTEYADSHTRLISFMPRPYSINAMILEKQITFKKDTELQDRDGPQVLSWVVYLPATADQYNFAKSPDDQTNGTWDSSTVIVDKLTRNSYLGIYPDFWGSAGVFNLGEDRPFRFAGGTVEGGFEIPKNFAKKGTVFEDRVLVIRGQPGQADGSELDNFYDVYGFDGTPAYTVTSTHGTIKDVLFAPIIEGDDYYATATITKANLPNNLGVMADGLNDNWDAGMLDTETGFFRRVGVVDGRGYLVVNVNNRDHSFTVGNLVTCDNENVRLALLKTSDGYTIEANNPTDADVEVTVEVPSWLAETVGAFSKTLVIKSGEIITMQP